jgi:hypothetical protein
MQSETPEDQRRDLWFFFQRCEGKNFDSENHVHYEFDALDVGITAEDLEEVGPIECLRLALEFAWASGMPKGSHRSGCFQVQSAFGIWRQVEGNRFDCSTPRKAAKIQFKTWDQLEQEELPDDLSKSQGAPRGAG